MKSYLIKDTTREEREQIVADSIGNISAYCDGCSAGLADMYQDYIDGLKELLKSIWSSTLAMSAAQKVRNAAAAS